MTELQRRVAVAAVAIPLGLLVIYLGDALLAALLGMLAFLGAREFFALVRSEGAEPFEAVGCACAAAIPLLAHADRLGILRIPAVVLVLSVLTFFAAAIWLRGPGARPLSAVSQTLFGITYTGGAISFGYLIRYHDYAVGAAAGTALLLLPLALTWTCDTAAYAVGRKMGKRKLMPSVSPGKTIEGACAGVIATVLAALLYVNVVLRPVAQLGIPVISIVVLGVAISVSAQVGDLAESMLKRSAGEKDSSNLIPGHGGILDRFDSLYFVLPLTYWMLGHMLVAAPHGQ
jgi:phosphatidate cytidylyltransferase